MCAHICKQCVPLFAVQQKFDSTYVAGGFYINSRKINDLMQIAYPIYKQTTDCFCVFVGHFFSRNEPHLQHFNLRVWLPVLS